MATYTFTEESTASDLSTFSDSGTLGGTDKNRLVLDQGGGSATSVSGSLAKGGSNNEYFITISSLPNVLAWGSGGVYTVNLNITTAAANSGTKITEVEIIRISSSGTILARLQATGLSISITTTGLKTQSLTDSSGTLNQPASAAQTDRLVAAIHIVNGSTKSTDSYTYETQVVANSDTVVTPITIPSGSALVKLVNETVDVSEAKLAIRHIVRLVNETINISEARLATRHIVRLINENVNASEAKLAVRKIVRLINETVNTSEARIVVRSIVRLVNETVNVTESKLAVRKLVRLLNETINVSEVITKIRGLVKILNETINIQKGIIQKKMDPPSGGGGKSRILRKYKPSRQMFGFSISKSEPEKTLFPVKAELKLRLKGKLKADIISYHQLKTEGCIEYAYNSKSNIHILTTQKFRFHMEEKNQLVGVGNVVYLVDSNARCGTLCTVESTTNGDICHSHEFFSSSKTTDPRKLRVITEIAKMLLFDL